VPTPEDLTRDCRVDRALVDLVTDDDRGEIWAIADAWLRRALAAEADLRGLSEENAALAEQVAELRDEVQARRSLCRSWEQRALAAEAEVARLRIALADTHDGLLP
jgi:hypothetical protein